MPTPKNSNPRPAVPQVTQEQLAAILPATQEPPCPPPMRTTHGRTNFRSAALNHFLFNAATKPSFQPTPSTAVPDLEHFCSPVIHPETGKLITKYQKLASDPALRKTWTTAFGKEFGGLAQGDNKTGAKGTNSLFVMDHGEIAHIPKDRTITYGRIVVGYRPQKADPNRV